MPRYTLAIVAGCCVAYYANALPDSCWTMFAPLLAFIAWLQPGYRLILLAAAVYLWSSAALHHHLDHRLAGKLDQRVSVLRGHIVDIPRIEDGRIRFDLKPTEIDGYEGLLPRRIRLNWYQDRVQPRPGEYWQFEARLRRPGGARNPAGFDYAGWQFAAGIDAGGSVRSTDRSRRLSPANPVNIDSWRGRLAAQIDRLCEHCRYRSVIKALAIGYRGDMSVEQRRILQFTGTAHLLAISGLHVGMLAFFGLLAGRLCWRSGLFRVVPNRTQCALPFALVTATAYAALAGFSLPTLRALIMCCVMLLTWRLALRFNLLQSISLALGIMLLCDPLAVGSASLWLSISALLVIAFAQLHSANSGSWWRQLVILQILFALLLLPLGLLLFGRINPAGFLANLIAIPLVSFLILPLVLLACAGAVFDAGWAAWLMPMTDRLIALLFEVLQRLGSGYLASVSLAGLPIPLLLWMLPSLLPWLLPGGWRLRGAAMLCLLTAFIWQPARLEQGSFELTVLDVGMGTSILIRTREHSLVYDFGPGKPGVFSAADWALLPLLRERRIERPDLVVVSHVDQDHSGGLHSVVDNEMVATLVSGTPQRLMQRFALAQPPRSCHSWPAWRWDGVDFRFLATVAVNETRGSNNRSCVLRVSGRHVALLPGDIEARQESRLLAQFPGQLRADILVAPHHGSETSSSPHFVRRVDPRYVVYTISRGNRWGFPREAVMARYAARGSRQLRTDIDGAISLLSASGGISVKTYGSPPKRLWRRW